MQRKKRLTFKDPTAPGGAWEIKTRCDVITALLSHPYFQTVDASILREVVDMATDDRQEYDDINDLAQHIALNYI